MQQPMSPTSWKCIHCNNIMDRTNFTEFIKQSDDDKNSNQEAKVQYHTWKPMPKPDGTITRTEALV
jgi:hypothetical protein